jgi:hypothetical protein
MNQKPTQNQIQTPTQTEEKIERAEQVLKTKVKTNLRAGRFSDKEWME